MKTAKERNEFLATSCVHRELQSSLDGFSAAVREVRSRGSLQRHDFVEFLRQLRHQRVVIISAAHVNQLGGLILNCAHDFRMTMTGRAHGDTGIAIEKKIAIDVSNPDALA